MDRALLNALPDWALILLFVIVTVLIGLGGAILVRRTRLAAWRDEESSQVVVGITAIALTFFALVLALVLVDLYANYKDASGNVTNEANTLVKGHPGRRRVSIAVSSAPFGQVSTFSALTQGP